MEREKNPQLILQYATFPQSSPCAKGNFPCVGKREKSYNNHISSQAAAFVNRTLTRQNYVTIFRVIANSILDRKVQMFSIFA